MQTNPSRSSLTLILLGGLFLAPLALHAQLESRPAPEPAPKTVVIAANSDGSFSPARVEIFTGDTVEWDFASRTDTIIPVNLNAAGQPDCVNFKPFDPGDPNEFTGPMPRAASGIFTISPEELPYSRLPRI